MTKIDAVVSVTHMQSMNDEALQKACMADADILSENGLFMKAWVYDVESGKNLANCVAGQGCVFEVYDIGYGPATGGLPYEERKFSDRGWKNFLKTLMEE